MKIKCFVGSCDNTPAFFCKCEGFPEVMCEDHYSTHSNKNKLSIHKLFPVFKRVNEESKENITNHINNMIKRNIILKQAITENTERILNISTQLVKLINELNHFLQSNIYQIYSNDKIMIASSLVKDDFNKIYKYEEASLDDIETAAADFIEFFKISQLQESFYIYSEKQKGLIDNINDLAYINYDKDELLFFRQNTNILVSFNPKDENIIQRSFESMVNQGYLASICKINKGELFVYGGYTSSVLTSCKLIKISDNSYKTLCSGTQLMVSSPQLYKNKIYIFGGSINANSGITDSKYYDLKGNKWFTIASLPSPQRDTSTLLIKNKILISGYQDFLHSYNFITNQYTNVRNGISIGNYNILIFYSNKIFLLVNNLVFLCDDLANTNNWKQVNSSQSFEYTSSKPCYHGKYAYFITYTNKLYKFDCETKTLSMIKQL